MSFGAYPENSRLREFGFFFLSSANMANRTLQRLELGWLEKRKRGEKLFSLVLVGFIII